MSVLPVSEGRNGRPAASVLVVAAALVVIAVIAMLLTSGQMSALRAALPPLSQAMSWLEALPGPFDMDHVAFFTLLAITTRVLWPGVRGWWLLGCFALLAASTELLQFLPVGRTPKLLDARDDMVGAGLGVLLGAVPRWFWQRLRRVAKGPRMDPMHRSTTVANVDVLHGLLACWLVGRETATVEAALAEHGVAAILNACEREGVTSLVHARLAARDAASVPAELLQALASRARPCAARSLLCLSEARKIQHALTAAGIPCVWLKGIALGQWLYPSAHLRDVADIDLLLPDHATTLRAAEVLAPLGYVLPNPHIAGDLVVHELLAWSERARLELDLHWDLSNGALFAGRLPWARLWEASVPVPGLGTEARGLSPIDALLHACIHRAANALVHQENRLRWLYDIHLVWEALSPEARVKAVQIAVDVSLADATHAALRSSRAIFATQVHPEALAALAAHANRELVRTDRLDGWVYLQVATLRVLPTGDSARWLRQLVFPDLQHLRRRYGADGAGGWRVLARRLRDGILRLRSYMRS